jgi:signal transduction histidine kinase
VQELSRAFNEMLDRLERERRDSGARALAAMEDERLRIARDLHDTVIQRLFAVGLSLQAALVRVSDSQTAQRVETAIDEIDGTIRDIRTSIFSLHARRMTTTGLRDEVLSTAREAARALGFDPHVTFEGPVDAATSQTVREHLVPTLREALSNAVRHAQATRVAIELAVAGDELTLCVVDNGVGVRDGHHGGRGLGNMTERALALGGRCTLRPAPGGGTVVEWRVSLGASSPQLP